MSDYLPHSYEEWDDMMRERYSDPREDIYERYAGERIPSDDGVSDEEKERWMLEDYCERLYDLAHAEPSEIYTPCHDCPDEVPF